MKSRLMRLLCIAGLSVVLVAELAEAHKQHVHQYVAREAYLLLRSALGIDIPPLQDHVGGLEPFYAGDSAWQRPFVTTGAWREDEEDVIFHYDAYEISPGLNYALVSITHFWDADQGDTAGNIFRLRVERPPLPPLEIDIGPYENACDKFLRYARGNWVLRFPRAFNATNASNGHSLLLTPLPVIVSYGVPISYNRLADLFRLRTCTLHSEQNITYIVYDETDGHVVDPGTVSTMLVEEGVRDAIVWETLGRMCHLLADMSVPAHAHRDEHGLLPDSYEEYMGGSGNPYAAWGHQNSGPLIDPTGTGDEALHFLIYVVQQMSDHFGSNGPAEGDGNDNAGGIPRPAETAFLDSLNLPSLGPPTTQGGPWTPTNLMNIRDRTFPVLIRATAGLLLWFSREASLITHVASLDRPVQFNLSPNYPNPFNPSTTISYEVPVGTRHAASLQIFDVLGRLVATLVNEVKEPGRYTARWDAGKVASGMYYYSLEAGEYKAVRKMLLLK
jgi:hypothetical protein